MQVLALLLQPVQQPQWRPQLPHPPTPPSAHVIRTGNKHKYGLRLAKDALAALQIRLLRDEAGATPQQATASTATSLPLQPLNVEVAPSLRMAPHRDATASPRAPPAACMEPTRDGRQPHVLV